MAKKTSAKPEPDQIPASVNPHLRKRRRQQYPASYYLEGIQTGDRVILGQAITLVESTKPADRKLARTIVEGCLGKSGHSFRLGITGVPGVGKSTFIESFGKILLEVGHKVAVLAVDPSSQISHGSILGDKTRMGELSVHPDVFIRPSPASGSLGGVAAKTRELILLCEAAGYDFILVETVGVGQSEVAVYQLTDFFLLLLLPGAGDELQGIKRGVVEMADLIAVNKADDDRKLLAQKARAAYQQALHLFPPKPSKWTAQALTCSAVEKTGLSEILDQIEAFRQQAGDNGYFQSNRQQQALHWFEQQLQQWILEDFFTGRKDQLEQLKAAVQAGTLSPQAAVDQLFSE
ncbi:MAG: methylmalonyl Co-A mutase-associated GTPase MeaB [Bacteroidota bacterium]